MSLHYNLRSSTAVWVRISSFIIWYLLKFLKCCTTSMLNLWTAARVHHHYLLEGSSPWQLPVTTSAKKLMESLNDNRTRQDLQQVFGATDQLKKMKCVDEAVAMKGLFFIFCVRDSADSLVLKNNMVTTWFWIWHAMISCMTCHALFSKKYQFPSCFLACYVWKIFLQ